MWKPEPLPATKRAGDVEVTLEKLSTGHSNNTSQRGLPGGRQEIEFGTNITPSETFFFRNVPLGSLDVTNTLAWRTNFGGATITLDYIFRRAPWTNMMSWSSSQLSQAHFSVSGLTNGLHFDLIAARTDNGTNLETGSWSSSDNYRSYDFRTMPLEAKTVDFHFAVQHSRRVEFTVKPEAGPVRIGYKPARGEVKACEKDVRLMVPRRL